MWKEFSIKLNVIYLKFLPSGKIFPCKTSLSFFSRFGKIGALLSSARDSGASEKLSSLYATSFRYSFDKL
jgi:hypothetical protein